MTETTRGPIRGLSRRSLDGLYGVYALLQFGVLCLAALLVVTTVPGARRRSRIVSAIIRTSFRLAGIEPEIRGIANLPEQSCVLVANHASYLDGLLLKGFMPGNFAFVIKGEMRGIPIVHFLLRRSGSRFVERFEAAASARDARQIVKAAQQGESLGFFPEGTFRRQPGVGRFHKGAFAAAGKGGIPVVPIAILGTRWILPEGRRLPRRGNIRVEILPAIMPDDPIFGDKIRLAETARQRIIAALGEPDLLQAPRRA